ncbi:MAG: HAMP domain-containing sensor histidine kinase, partial [Planctomycetota bacterium]|nr:HAMP domain-containing sensor histidine kinase [Planctomycetota bacterium]
IVRANRRGSEARISVQDHGPGIPESEQKHIFEKFYRAKDVGPSGCGLGLAIVRAILHGHGGRAEVTSRVGEGSTFTLILPVAPPGAPKDTRTDSGTPARNV